MLDLCLVGKWSGIKMVVWKQDCKKPVYGQKWQVFEWSAKSCGYTIWIPDTHTVWYSDGYCTLEVCGLKEKRSYLLCRWLLYIRNLWSKKIKKLFIVRANRNGWFQITDFGSAKIVRNDGRRSQPVRRRRRTGDNREDDQDSDETTR